MSHFLEWRNLLSVIHNAKLGRSKCYITQIAIVLSLIQVNRSPQTLKKKFAWLSNATSSVVDRSSRKHSEQRTYMVIVKLELVDCLYT